MPTLNSGELLQAVMDSCHMSTEAVLYIDGQNPYRLLLNGRTCTFFVANITHARRADPDEFRIQCPGNMPSRLAASEGLGETISILGYHVGSGTFSAWDPRLFSNRSHRTQRFSMYTRLSGLQRASTLGFTRYVDSEGQAVLLFRPEYLSLYIENSEFIHEATDAAIQRIVDVYGATPVGVAPERRVVISKRRVQVTHIQFARSPQFRAEVLTAYEHSCAMCGMQLELIEAAHFIPHAHPDGLDEVGNGIALCALHHKSLDTGLVYVDVNYHIRINQTRYTYLRKAGAIGGILQYRRQLRLNIAVPEDDSKHPIRENIVRGNHMRGIGVE